MEVSNNSDNVNSDNDHTIIVIEEDPVKVKNRIIRQFPWFLFSWTIVLIFVFVYVDNSHYAYGCKQDIFEWRLVTYHMFHLNIEHIAFNLIGFWLFGIYIHMVYNDLVNMLIYTFGVVSSGITYHIDCSLNKRDTRIIGASGGVCAIVGAVFVIALWRFINGICELGQDYSLRQRIKYSIIKYLLSFTTIFSTLCLISYDIAMYYTEGNSNTSHISHFGGYISGAFAGVIIITTHTYILKNKNNT